MLETQKAGLCWKPEVKKQGSWYVTGGKIEVGKTIPYSLPGRRCGTLLASSRRSGPCGDIAHIFDNSVLISQNREYTVYTGTLLGKRSAWQSGYSASICHGGASGYSGQIPLFVWEPAGGIYLKVQSGDMVICFPVRFRDDIYRGTCLSSIRQSRDLKY